MEKKKKLKEKAKEHLLKGDHFDVPRWSLYAITIVAVIFFGYGLVQQFRIWRWSGIMAASKSRIIELEAKNSQARLQGMQEIAKNQKKANKQELKEIKKELSTSKQEQEKEEKKIDAMKPSELLKAFKEEGF